MTLWIERKPYWLKPEQVPKVELMKNATFMGQWCVKRGGIWSEDPIDVFYQANPDKANGHTNYFGFFVDGGKLYITDAESAFSEQPMAGVLAADGSDEVIVSRYRHDYQCRKGVMIDGGRDYTRSASPMSFVAVTVEGPEFKFEQDNARVAE